MSRILGSVSSFHAVIVMTYSISIGRLQEGMCVCVCVGGGGGTSVGVADEFLLMWFQ